jgi:hypothetical protein
VEDHARNSETESLILAMRVALSALIPTSMARAQRSYAGRSILQRRVTATDLVKMYLARIKAYNGTCVNEPSGILGPISTIPHAGQVNALMTLNLRPKARAAWGFGARKACASLRHRAQSGRVERRLWHRGGREPGDLRDRRGIRHFGARAREEQQHGRHRADARAGERRWHVPARAGDSVGPICRTVEDTPRVLDAFAGFDPKDDFTRDELKAIDQD